MHDRTNPSTYTSTLPLRGHQIIRRSLSKPLPLLQNCEVRGQMKILTHRMQSTTTMSDRTWKENKGMPCSQSSVETNDSNRT